MYLLNIAVIFLVVFVGYLVIKNIDTTKVYNFSPIPTNRLFYTTLGLVLIIIIIGYIFGSIETNKENKTIK